ncbi:MAG: DUF1552 domain-containing protein [Acidobacteria bacterium]|nr:DUF1552 domain-containing protein [Acidobacteriota bacterium]
MTLVSKKSLHRRTLLRGAGAAIALPLLDAMQPAFAAAAAKSPVRLSFSYVPNGIIMDHWKPTGEGANFALGRIMQPLAPFKKDLLIVSGLADHNGNALGDGGGDHARAGGSFLTSSHPKKTGGADIHAGISIDQVAANQLGQNTQLPSLELGLDDARTVGNCDSGYSCAYTNSLSWRAPSSPLPPEYSPRRAFERLFGTEDVTLDPETRARRAVYRKSILDLAQEDTKKLISTLGASDKRKIDEYLYAIREIEKRIANAERDASGFRPSIEKPTGIPVSFVDHAKLMYDLQVMAFQADLTRIGTMVIGREGSVRTYPEIGVPDPHHPLTHHQNNPERIERVTKINELHAELFAYYLKRLKETPDGDGSLLDHSLALYGSGLSDGNRHLHEDLPIVVAGHGNGSLKTGRYLALPEQTPLSNLFLAMLDQAGAREEQFGDSTGKLDLGA